MIPAWAYFSVFSLLLYQAILKTTSNWKSRLLKKKKEKIEYYYLLKKMVEYRKE